MTFASDVISASRTMETGILPAGRRSLGEFGAAQPNSAKGSQEDAAPNHAS
jgi:hypothetical protein